MTEAVPTTTRPEPIRIALRGLRGFGRHGVFEFERDQGQVFLVDVALDVSVPAAASDDLADTVDYGSIAEQVVALVEGPPVQLLERLAEQIAALCLADGRVDAVDVTVHKPEAPLTVPCDDVSVTIRRSRA
jgi:dihydroneopterin aldolase